MTKLLKLFIILIAIFSSCSSTTLERKTKKFTSIDPQIDKYINEYIALAKKKGTGKDKDLKKGLSAGLGDIGKSNNIVGVCFNFENGLTEIEIDELYWGAMGDAVRRILVFHEATHCICDRNHDHDGGVLYPDGQKRANPKWSPEILKEKGYFGDLCPVSIMHPFIPDAKCIDDHLSHYLDEMLEGCQINYQ